MKYASFVFTTNAFAMLIVLSSLLSFQLPFALASALHAPNPIRQISSSEKHAICENTQLLILRFPGIATLLPILCTESMAKLGTTITPSIHCGNASYRPSHRWRSQSFMSENCSKLFLPQEIVIVVILHLILFSLVTVFPAWPCLILLALGADGCRRPSRSPSTWDFLSFSENRFSLRVRLPEFPIDPNARRACFQRVTHFSWFGDRKT